MKRFKRKKSFKGITLIELLVVLALIAVLISVFFVGITQIQKARDADRKADLEKIKIALYDYYFDSNCFPQNLPSCGEYFGSGTAAYLTDFPCDPKGMSYAYEIEGGECPQWFKIMTNLENIRDPDIDKVHCRNGCGLPDCPYNYGLASTNISVYEGCVAYYACKPGGECAEYDDPFISRCPKIFIDDPTCGGILCDPPDYTHNWCHDASGVHVPD